MSGVPTSRTLRPGQAKEVRALLEGRGHVPRRNPKNPYIAFEVRTPDRSIVTLYTSGKLVVTLRDGDAEGAAIGAALDALLGGAAPPGAGAAAPRRGTASDLRLLVGVDETGTGELLGSAIAGGAAFPPGLADAVAAIAGGVDTKASRAVSGWERLATRLFELRARGFGAATLPIPNALFDAYNKNALLDLAYVRLVGDLRASTGLADRDLEGVELVVDDYGVGALLTRAVEGWRGEGATVVVAKRADDTHLAARAASVLARSHRAREMAGLAAESTDGPLGSGNAGDPQTLEWLRRHADRDGGWPSFVKSSFRTVRDLAGLEPARKAPVPEPRELLDAGAARAFLAGRLDVAAAKLRAPGEGRARLARRLHVDTRGRLVAPSSGAAAERALAFLPLLCGGLVPGPGAGDFDLLGRMLLRDRGLLAGWRVLVGPSRDDDDPRLVALARAHRAGVVSVVPTAEADPVERARRHAGVLLTTDDDAPGLLLRVHA